MHTEANEEEVDVEGEMRVESEQPPDVVRLPYPESNCRISFTML